MAETPAPTTAKNVDPLVGQTLAGRFKILSLIDRGGMGKIYKAEQQPLGRVVALKTLDIVDHTGEFKKRFFLEASVCAKLTHPNTVRIFDYGATEDASVYFLVMEFLQGAQLHQLIQEQAPLEPLRAIRIARQIASALTEAHEQGIVHRDLKPQNVFLTKHGDDAEFVKVVDFGLVKELGFDSEVSRSGNVLGSPMYMAPEQVESEAVDQRTDVYALGLILFVMLTGQTAFKRGSSLSVMMQQVHAEPPKFKDVAPKLNLPASLEWAVQTAIRKNKDERFATMRELIRALKACERELRLEVPPVAMKLDAGRLVLPPGVEVSEETRLPDGNRRRTAPAPEEASQSIVRTMTRPAPLALGFLSLLMMGTAAVIAVIALVAIGVMFWGGPSPEGAGSRVAEPSVAAVSQPPVPAPVVEAPEPVVAETAPVAAPEPVVVEVALTSDPAGAEILEGGVVIGNTPFTIRVEDGAARTLELSAPGRQKKTVRVDGAQAAVNVSLPRSGGGGSKGVAPTEPAKTEPAKTEPATTPPEIKRTQDVRNPFGH